MIFISYDFIWSEGEGEGKILSKGELIIIALITYRMNMTKLAKCSLKIHALTRISWVSKLLKFKSNDSSGSQPTTCSCNMISFHFSFVIFISTYDFIWSEGEGEGKILSKGELTIIAPITYRMNMTKLAKCSLKIHALTRISWVSKLLKCKSTQTPSTSSGN